MSVLLGRIKLGVMVRVPIRIEVTVSVSVAVSVWEARRLQSAGHLEEHKRHFSDTGYRTRLCYGSVSSLPYIVSRLQDDSPMGSGSSRSYHVLKYGTCVGMHVSQWKG